MSNEQLIAVLRTRDKNEISNFLNVYPELFDDVINLALTNNKPLCWRAAWMLSDAMEQNDLRIQPHVLKIIEQLPYFKNGHQRELLKILLQMKLEEEFESLYFDLCINLWEQVRKQSSVRHFAFKGMLKVATKYPELKNEVLALAQPHFVNSLSPGIRKSIIKSISDLETNTSNL